MTLSSLGREDAMDSFGQLTLSKGENQKYTRSEHFLQSAFGHLVPSFTCDK